MFTKLVNHILVIIISFSLVGCSPDQIIAELPKAQIYTDGFNYVGYLQYSGSWYQAEYALNEMMRAGSVTRAEMTRQVGDLFSRGFWMTSWAALPEAVAEAVILRILSAPIIIVPLVPLPLPVAPEPETT